MSRIPRIVVTGQIPPPIGGQALMIRNLIQGLEKEDRCTLVHVPFYFTKKFSEARQANAGKIIELVKVIGRLLRLRARGQVDLLVFAPGGPQRVPLIRDLLLLPWVLLVSKRVLLHFHAGGIYDLLQAPRPFLAKLAAGLYRRADSAVVMNEFSVRDPEACGIRNIAMIPHRIEDQFKVSFVERGRDLRILYVGNLHDDKGTSVLLRAFLALSRKHPEASLELAGEFIPPYNEGKFVQEVAELGIGEQVRWLGKISGDLKSRTFGKASLLVFPTVAPSESFGLVMVEGMMWGLPVLASDWRGNKDVLGDAAGGILFQPADSSEALAEALISFAENRDQWEAWGQANRQYFLSHYWADGKSRELMDFILLRAGAK